MTDRIEDAPRNLGAEHKPPPDFKERVMAELMRERARLMEYGPHIAAEFLDGACIPSLARRYDILERQVEDAIRKHAGAVRTPPPSWLDRALDTFRRWRGRVIAAALGALASVMARRTGVG